MRRLACPQAGLPPLSAAPAKVAMMETKISGAPR